MEARKKGNKKRVATINFEKDEAVLIVGPTGYRTFIPEYKDDDRVPFSVAALVVVAACIADEDADFIDLVEYKLQDSDDGYMSLWQ